MQHTPLSLALPLTPPLQGADLILRRWNKRDVAGALEALRTYVLWKQSMRRAERLFRLVRMRLTGWDRLRGACHEQVWALLPPPPPFICAPHGAQEAGWPDGWSGCTGHL